MKLQDVRDAFGRDAFLMMVPLLSAEAIKVRAGGTPVAGVVGRDPGSAYGTWFPDVPGCHSAADEEEDILEMASEALTVHLEGEALQRARPLAEILQIEEVCEDLARGDCLVLVPLPSAGQVSGEVREN